jgi:MoxR-like ATPase
MSKAIARLRGRDYVVPKDVQECFATTLGHRLQLSAEAEGQGLEMEQVLKSILGKVPAPKLQ